MHSSYLWVCGALVDAYGRVIEGWKRYLRPSAQGPCGAGEWTQDSFMQSIYSSLLNYLSSPYINILDTGKHITYFDIIIWHTNHPTPFFSLDEKWKDGFRGSFSLFICIEELILSFKPVISNVGSNIGHTSKRLKWRVNWSQSEDRSQPGSTTKFSVWP